MNNYVFNYITTTSMIFSCLFLGYFNILSKGKDYKHHFILGRNGLAVYKLVSHGACPALPHPALPCPAPPCPYYNLRARDVFEENDDSGV